MHVCMSMAHSIHPLLLHISPESGATLPDEATNSKSSDLKTGTVRLTEEEKKMLAEEGIILPTNMALTKVRLGFAAPFD